MLEDDDPGAAVGAGLIRSALRARLEALAAGRRRWALSALANAHLPEALRALRQPRARLARASCLRNAE